MTRPRQFIKRSSFFALAACLFGAWVLGDVALFSERAQAAQLTSRSLTVSSSANGSINVGNPGEGSNGARARHTVTFTMATSGSTIGSIALIYCTIPLPQTSCTSNAANTGNASNLTSASVSGSGLGGSGWALDTTTSNPTVTGYGTCNGSTGTTRDNCVLVKPSSTGANTGTPTITIQYGGAAGSYVTNPTNDNDTFFVRVVVFSGASYSGVIDNGTVASSTAQQIDITAKVQEVLNFSVGAPVPEGSVPAPGASGCDPLTDDGGLALGDATDGVLSFTQAFDAHSYFRVSTNAINGVSVSYSGDTLKMIGSPTTTIDAIGTTAEASDVGTEQFGLGIDSGDATSNGFNFTNLAASSPYDQGDGTIVDGGTAMFAFDTASVTTPDEIATSAGAADKTIVCDTGSVRYLGNISTTTPAGIYTTTVTFIATPTY